MTRMTIRTDIFMCFAAHNRCRVTVNNRKNIHGIPAPSEKPKLKNKPVRLNLEDVLEWGESFKALMTSPEGRKLFYDYLKKEYSHENILFYEACLELNALEDEDEIFDKVRNIYEDYVSTLSPREISVDSWIRDDIQEKMINPDKHIFKHAVDHIYTLMLRDSYPRFKNSEVYKEALQQSRSNL